MYNLLAKWYLFIASAGYPPCFFRLNITVDSLALVMILNSLSCSLRLPTVILTGLKERLQTYYYRTSIVASDVEKSCLQTVSSKQFQCEFPQNRQDC